MASYFKSLVARIKTGQKSYTTKWKSKHIPQIFMIRWNSWMTKLKNPSICTKLRGLTNRFLKPTKEKNSKEFRIFLSRCQVLLRKFHREWNWTIIMRKTINSLQLLVRNYNKTWHLEMMLTTQWTVRLLWSQATPSSNSKILVETSGIRNNLKSRMNLWWPKNTRIYSCHISTMCSHLHKNLNNGTNMYTPKKAQPIKTNLGEWNHWDNKLN